MPKLTLEIEPSLLLKVMSESMNMKPHEVINFHDNLMELSEGGAITEKVIADSLKNSIDTGEVPAEQKINVYPKELVRTVLDKHLDQYFYEVDDSALKQAVEVVKDWANRVNPLNVTEETILNKLNSLLRISHPNAHPIQKPEVGEWGENIMFPEETKENEEPQTGERTSVERPRPFKDKESNMKDIPLSITAKKKDKWMQGATNPAETGELRAKYEKHFNVKLDKGDKLSTEKLKQWKKSLQAKGEGDKKMSGADRETLQQIIFALNARK